MKRKRKYEKLPKELFYAVKYALKQFPEKTHAEISEYVGGDISPATVGRVKKFDSYEDIEADNNRLAALERERAKKRREEAIRQKEIEDVFTQQQLPIDDDSANQDVNLQPEESFCVAQTEESAVTTEELFRKYFMIPASGQYEAKTIGQQLTCAVIAIGALRNEFHKDVIGQSNETTFGKKVLDCLDSLVDCMSTLGNNQVSIANNQGFIIHLLSRLVDQWEGKKESEETA